MPGALPLIHAVRTETFHAPASNLVSVPSAGASPFVSDTKELTWDPRGVFSVSAPGFSAATGLPQNLGGVDAGAMTIVSSSDHATITWLALDGKVLVDSRRSLLTVATRMQNTGMLWDGSTTIHDNWGTAPTLISPVRAVLRFRVRADSLKLSPLTVLGGEGSGSRVIFPSDANTFTVSIDQSAEKTPWYGVKPMGTGVPTGGCRLTDNGDNVPPEQNFPNPFNPSYDNRIRCCGKQRLGLGSRVWGLVGSGWSCTTY